LSTGARGMLIPKMADYGGDQCKSKSVQDWKRKQKQSASEGIKKIKGGDAERRRAKQRQHTANLRARETGNKKVPASDKHYWLASFGK